MPLLLLLLLCLLPLLLGAAQAHKPKTATQHKQQLQQQQQQQHQPAHNNDVLLNGNNNNNNVAGLPFGKSSELGGLEDAEEEGELLFPYQFDEEEEQLNALPSDDNEEHAVNPHGINGK